MRILIVGAGATGGYFGGRLAAAGRDVSFLVRPGRAAQLRAGGLQILSPSHGDLTLQPQIVETGDLAGPYDAVLLSVKAYALEGAMTDLAPAVGPETVLVPILNGMRHLETLTERYGTAVLGGVCKVATELDAEGRIRQLAALQELSYGEQDGRLSPRVERLDAALQGAGFAARASTTILQDMWDKWVMLATLGGITCLMRGPVGAVNSVPGGGAFAASLLQEIASVAAASGHPPATALMQRLAAGFTDPASTQTSSMYRDLAKGQPIEGAQIIGDLLARARGFGLETPLLATVDVHLGVYGATR
ncbi:2-dehydropantoate 2-reductase [Pseudoroseomonas deserti]|uniref:2-dehydropantoate 2-reductase n=1 Tax=Teichococcus deserti TaxID=1817963 RepID=A0A1V2H5D0_9PROT|nr:ketopantoate reductase family protein [Pseudoroseomonas deserti]ONG55968.1 2-dehydropantoate 2-reductase [Pseudoroseomonas deserti]